jgi:hypothetical protein
LNPVSSASESKVTEAVLDKLFKKLEGDHFIKAAAQGEDVVMTDGDDASPSQVGGNIKLDSDSDSESSDEIRLSQVNSDPGAYVPTKNKPFGARIPEHQSPIHTQSSAAPLTRQLPAAPGTTEGSPLIPKT